MLQKYLDIGMGLLWRRSPLLQFIFVEVGTLYLILHVTFFESVIRGYVLCKFAC